MLQHGPTVLQNSITKVIKACCHIKVCHILFYLFHQNLMFSNTDHFVEEDGTLKITSVNKSDAGVYTCEALNTGGAVTASATIRVIGTSL